MGLADCKLRSLPKIRDNEARRAYFRDAQREYRARKKKEAKKKDCTEEEAEAESTIRHTVNTLSLTPTLEDIYNAYPRKVARANALAAIEKAIKRGFGRAFLLERTVTYAKTQVPNDRYTPHPTTWFNQDRFNDDPATWETSNNDKPRRLKPWEIMPNQQ